MGEEVVCSSLRSKFSSILHEAEADPSSPSHIISRFRSIERLINFMCDSSSTTTQYRSSSRDSSISVDLLYDLIDALSECRIFTHQRHKAVASKKGFYFFRVFLFRKNMRRRLDEIEKKLKSGSPDQDSNGQSPPGLVFQQTYPILDPSLIIGFKSQAEKIEALLLKASNNSTNAAGVREGKDEEEEEAEEFTAIGIVGRCGSGKTALAQKVFANPKIQDEFSPRIWVCLSNMLFENERVDPRVRVLNYILEEIGYDIAELEYADHSVVKLLEKLQRGLMGKRYLIVLDNVWRVDEWYTDLDYRLPRDSPTGEFFSHGLPKGSGGAVIVTSRRKSVIRRTVGDKHMILLEYHLSDQTCWDIFSSVVRQQGKINPDDHPKLNEMVCDVVRNCDGLPLAAKTLANIIPNLL